MKHIAIFASGSGTNAQAIIEYFLKNPVATVDLIVCNNPKAYVVERAKEFHIPVRMVTRKEFYESDDLLNQLSGMKIDLIVLAGFLWLIPENLLKAFPRKIINIHPALLPKYGGKGMYGSRVHEAVIAGKEKETGITIHYLNEKYDEGEIIFQSSVPVTVNDTPSTIAEKVHKLEHENYPEVIAGILSGSK